MAQRIRLACIAVALLLGSGWLPTAARSQTRATKGVSANAAVTGNRAQIERGRYIVENVAMCERCHTPRDARGNPDRSRWLMGGPVQTRVTYPVATAWPQLEPRLAGTPPGTDEDLIRLLTTGISRTGFPPNPPMPPFRMTREDAAAVVAYLKSL